MFERFSEPARRVVVLAQDEACSLRHNYIGTEHLLLGLLREQDGVAGQVLESVDITVERVRVEVIRAIGVGEEITSGQIPFTPRAKRVMELALREALSLGHDYIGTEHLLLGLVRENGGVAARILLEFDTDAELIRSHVLRTLSARPGPPVAPTAEVVARSRWIEWHRAAFLWRPEGLELRIPLRLNLAEIAAFANDPVFLREPFTRLRREIWQGWLALASPTLLDDADPRELRRLLEEACHRAVAGGRSESLRLREFLDGLQAPP